MQPKTVGELIERLQAYPPEMPIRGAINQYNKVYPVIYDDAIAIASTDNKHLTIGVRLPYGWYTVKGKDAQK